MFGANIADNPIANEQVSLIFLQAVPGTKLT